MHHAYLLLGSNIEPEANLGEAIRRLRRVVQIEAISTAWESLADGSPGPNFLNCAIEISTKLNATELKDKILRPIEQELGRIRTRDKNAPRTIDIDIMVFDREIYDTGLWLDVYRALPVAELLPDLRDPQTGLALKEIANHLQENSFAKARPELNNLFNSL
ncbi:MAG: 2-amino-4-hydroxy-6-hydroxymethyldihydropteridine diphosphokinase [Anaerolineaceae bacterium]|nr:2-amino-4-hydroxy-6-hydroxymethyldihydropteridine diphosphokinase [Anaerolineaceae bacterium]